MDSSPQRYFYRVSILASIDAVVILPINICILIFSFLYHDPLYTITSDREDSSAWYPRQIPAGSPDGWTSSFWTLFAIHWLYFVNVFLALIIFILLGTTKNARESYKRVIWLIGRGAVTLLTCKGHSHPSQQKQDATETASPELQIGTTPSSIVVAEVRTTST